MTKTPEEMAEEYIRYENEAAYWTKHAFLAGYQAAMNSPEKLDSCDHILDMEKMVDVNFSNNSNGWISVKDRLPSCGVLCAWISDTTQSCIARIEVDDMHPWYEGFDYWCELPEPPKEEK